MTKQERDALRLVNKIRRYEGRKVLARLPKGDIGEMFSCPLARALNHGRVGIGDTLMVSPRAKQKIAALKKARITETSGSYCVVGCEGMLHFKMPECFNTFVVWFDYQKTEEAEGLVR